MRHFLDFEKPIAELESKLDELRALPAADGVIAEDIKKISDRVDALMEATYAALTPWQKTQVARHPERPRFHDYVGALIEDWQPLRGDRAFGDDTAIQAGLGRFNGFSVAVIGHEKGWDTESRIKHNFGMARPEGYRKAIRIMRLAEQFALPVITLVDTAGAYPGVDAEERGQAEAIARAIETCLDLRSPIVSAIIGEGGSGGAIAIAAADRVVMLEHAIYSVISPEGCASILWRTAAEAQTAAEALRLTAQDLHQHKVIDEIVAEPHGGAHRDKAATIEALGHCIDRSLRGLVGRTPRELKRARRDKFLAIGRGVA